MSIFSMKRGSSARPIVVVDRDQITVHELVREPRPETNKGEVTAEVIQREMVDRTEVLIAEVNSILAEKEGRVPNERARRLQELGFGGHREVVEQRERTEKEEASERMAEVVQQHRRDYPGLKFITDQVMQEVCGKYGLVLGGVDRYSGDVPTWAMDRLEGLMHIAKPFVVHDYRFDMRSSFFGTLIEQGSWAKRQARMLADKRLKVLGMCDMRTNMPLSSAYVTNDEAVAKEYGVECRTVLLNIAAPAKEMRVQSHERVHGGRITAVQDPIVCVEVLGGWLVLVAWGEEGQDPKVFNAESN